MPSRSWLAQEKERQVKWETTVQKNFIKSQNTFKRYRNQCEIDRRKYYEGFNVGREKEMFQEELKDLEQTYKETLVNVENELENCKPSLVYYMKHFIALYEKRGQIIEKLQILLEKTGRKPSEEDYGGEDE